MNKVIFTFSFLFLIFSNVACSAQNNTRQEINLNRAAAHDKKANNESTYKVGQMWSYKTRPNENASYFIVLEIDADEKLGNIIHIALRNLKMKNPNNPNEFYESADHLPFTEQAINKSAVKIIKESVELPNYEEGYKMWKEAFDAKKAGVYTAMISEAVSVMEKNLNQ